MSRITVTVDTPDTLETRDFAFEVDNALNIGFKHPYEMWTVEPKPTVIGKFPAITLDTVFKNEASNINTASYDRDVVGTTIPTKLFEGFAKLSPLSTIEAELIRHGRWIIGNKTSVFDLAGVETWAVRMTCSECSFSLNFVEGRTAQYRFCPYCGAKMEASDD